MDHSLERTFDPKVSHYHADGSGRDAYILYNNGGFLSYKAHSKTPKAGLTFNIATNSALSPRKSPQIKRYYGNGSGRDNYIIDDSGGFLKTYKNEGYLRNF
jgi:hypothetical protein